MFWMCQNMAYRPLACYGTLTRVPAHENDSINIYIYIISFIKLPHSGNSTWLWKITKFNMFSVEIVISQFANCKKLLGEHQRVYIYIYVYTVQRQDA